MKKTLLLTTMLAASLSAQGPQEALGQYANFVVQSPVQNIDTLQNADKKFKIGVDYLYDNADNVGTHFINIPVQGLVTENIFLEATLPFKYASIDGQNNESGLSDIMIGGAYSFGSMEAGSSRNVLGLRYNFDSGVDVIDAKSSSLDFYWDTMGKISNFTLRSGLLFNYAFGYDLGTVDVDGGFDSLLSIGLGHECLLTESLQTNAIISWYSSYGDSTVLGDIPGTNYDLVDLTLKWDTLKLNNRQISFGAKIPLYATDFNGQDYKSFTFFVNAGGLF